ncbi:aminopeptidase N [Salinimicrobium sediminis]|uniref:Aminopeptidase N n=1 Tax=Salinimicrobium sediminis TaxID=1343891 RepID=A0A285X6A9_9FLAO|nr:M1 family metallopeptidase [Salinimicrobium sediminis]SOC80546.1 aminopeptidase N [Salinimicrobium sediminis]
MKLPFFFSFLGILSGGMQAQQSAAVDFTHLQANVKIDPFKKAVSGDVVYTFDILEATDSIFIDAQKMHFSEVFLNNAPAEFGTDGKKFWLTGSFTLARDQQLRLKYRATPGQTMYFINKTALGETPDFQVWTQGQGRYTSHWLPSFDNPAEKLEFDLSVIYPSGETVIANGELQKTEILNDSLTQWRFDMDRPMSSYLVAIAAGDYEKEIRFSKNGIPLELYYPAGMENKVEPTYRHSEFFMNYFEEKIGVAYPWEIYKQIPVQDFLYAGMENTGATIFSDLFLVDSTGYQDQNYVNVNAHELAHQWFGNLVTAASPEHHWLQEGFSTYYALLAEKEIFGEDYYYRKLFKTAEELKQLSDQGKGMALVSKNANSLTYYQKGAWALHILQQLIGDEAFDAGVRNYLEKYKFGTATTEDLLVEMEATSGMDLSVFEKNWLRQSAFQGTEALESLKKSPFIQKYLELAAAKPLPISEKRELLEEALSFPINDYLGQEAVLQLALESPATVTDLYKKAFSSGNIYTRQAIAFSLQQIPQQLKSQYETLLNDESYLTQESALYNLWMNFPEDRLKYLNQLEGVEGFNSKNIRTLWLALSLATPEVSAESKKKFITELESYTAPHQKFQVRENAFGYLYQLNAFSSETIYNLMEAARHHNYRFREFSKQLLKTLVDNGQLSAEEQDTIQKKLDEK